MPREVRSDRWDTDERRELLHVAAVLGEPMEVGDPWIAYTESPNAHAQGR
jgi:hypothetical protein